MSTAAIHSPRRNAPRPASQVLDPCTLGRPIHLLNGFTAALVADLSEFFRREFNRRYGATFELGAVSFSRAAPLDPATPRWLTYANEVGCIGFALERKLLLGVVGYRYGETPGSAPADDDEPMRETATEERLAANLGLRLVCLLGARIEAGGHAMGAEPQASKDFIRATAGVTAGAWTIRADLRERALGIEGRLWFTLDAAWMARLLRRLAPPRSKPAEAVQRVLPLGVRLQLMLTGHLLQKELPLGELMDLRVGDVIPVNLGAADVLVDESRLFTAAVAEHKGKLCLTAFQYLE